MLENETVFKQHMINAQKGDATAYNELLSNLYLFLNNYLRKRIFEQRNIEDVIQEILVAVHKSLHTYDSEKSFMSWLMAITEYKVIDYIRALRKQTKPSDLNSIPNFFAGMHSDSDLRIDIDKALNRLNHKEKTILNLLKVDGQSVSEVAKQLHLTEGNVKVIAHRAYTNLKIYLGVRP
ncbi:MAG: sigma-70 family RNA polymerase sigma factor [Bdellovibrionaceae bacterium]|nr:sigma-70 family RNA polymerase sigma factor [Pseudobdellovibrionaceae bacterium]